MKKAFFFFFLPCYEKITKLTKDGFRGKTFVFL